MWTFGSHVKVAVNDLGKPGGGHCDGDPFPNCNVTVSLAFVHFAVESHCANTQQSDDTTDTFVCVAIPSVIA